MKYLALTVSLIIFLSSSCSKKKIEQTKEEEDLSDPEISIDLSDEELLDFTEKTTFAYFWDYAEINSGAARERYIVANSDVDKHLVTTGGTGFGLMALLVGMERGFITSKQGFDRIFKILNFFYVADRFHGAWPHWLDGTNGKTIPFSEEDNGGDLVETSFFAQGLIAVREYYKKGTTEQQTLAALADELWQGIEWDWYTRNENSLFWHWSPTYGWDLNLKIQGYNECLIAYVLAASSTTYPIEKEVYLNGWARNGAIKSSNTQYGYPLTVVHAGPDDNTGPLFWSHYSFLGLNPNGLSDEFVDYEQAVINHSRINYQYCVENPLSYRDYGKNCWGLTASYSRSENGELTYKVHRPGDDLGIISPTAAISSMPYTPEESRQALRYFYFLKDKLMGDAGFYDAFSPQYNYWVAPAYLAIDQGPIIIMIENYRSKLLWNLFMGAPEIQQGLKKLGFQ